MVFLCACVMQTETFDKQWAKEQEHKRANKEGKQQQQQKVAASTLGSKRVGKEAATTASPVDVKKKRGTLAHVIPISYPYSFLHPPLHSGAKEDLSDPKQLMTTLMEGWATCTGITAKNRDSDGVNVQRPTAFVSLT
jgi:hypothetical protein